MLALQSKLLKDKNYLFWMLLFVSFGTLLVYRLSIHAPVWFDEIFLKAFLFGAPMWIYALVSKQKPAFFGMESSRFWTGAFNGLAIGGILSFVAMVTYGFRKETLLVPGLFETAGFWKEFGLAFATAWWESIFFYGLVLPVLNEKIRDELNALALTSLVFLIFHVPNIVLKAGLAASLQPLLLLALFAFGQGVIFLRTKSISTVVVSHAFWGMALLVYGR